MPLLPALHSLFRSFLPSSSVTGIALAKLIIVKRKNSSMLDSLKIWLKTRNTMFDFQRRRCSRRLVLSEYVGMLCRISFPLLHQLQQIITTKARATIEATTGDLPYLFQCAPHHQLWRFWNMFNKWKRRNEAFWTLMRHLTILSNWGETCERARRRGVDSGSSI